MTDRTARFPAPEELRRSPLGPLLALVVLAIVALVSYRITVRTIAERRRDASAKAMVTGASANERRSGRRARSRTDGEDLTVIEGIGPKYEEVLKAAGITTYRELADARPDHLEAILRESSGRLANPATWPEQAQLAADDRWQDLQDLQRELKGGRRVN